MNISDSKMSSRDIARDNTETGVGTIHQSLTRQLIPSPAFFVCFCCFTVRLPRPFCPSVCPSVKRIVPTFLYHIKDDSIFLIRRMVGGGDLSSRNFRPNWPWWSENPDFQSIFASSASAVTPSEKVHLIRISTTSFPTSLRWTVYVASKSPKGGGGLKNAWSIWLLNWHASVTIQLSTH